MATAWYQPYEFHATLRFSGSCRPNPGHGSIGFLIFNDYDGTVLEKYSTYVNDCFRLTNNAAHYKALIAGLQHALWRGVTHITARGHCQLVCQQVMGKWRVDKPSLKRYCDRVRQLASQFRSFNLEHIYCKYNSDARALAREGFDSTFVDRSNRAECEILQRCSDPESAKKYVLEQRCDGYHKMKYILDTLQCRLPQSYAAVLKLCNDIWKKIGGCRLLRNNRARACLLGIYQGFCMR